MIWFIAALISVGQLLAYPQMPNHTNVPHLCTPKDPDFKEYRYASFTPICNRRVLASTKVKIYTDYGIPLAERPMYSIDHLVPLFMGGSNHRLNLWPQHQSISTVGKEGELYREVASGRMSISEAFNTIMAIKFKAQ